MAAIKQSPSVTVRQQLATLCNHMDLLGHAVEIGVDRAGFACQFLQEWAGADFTAVDDWAPIEDNPRWRRDRGPDYLMACAALARFNHRARILKATSADASQMVFWKLDFAYIDADHRYENVAQDIRLWWPKVKPGGILAGHDFHREHFPGVYQAVCEFAERDGRLIHRTSEEWSPSWFIFKED